MIIQLKKRIVNAEYTLSFVGRGSMCLHERQRWRNGKDVLYTYDEVYPRTVVCFYIKISMAALVRLCLLSLSERRDGPAFAHRKTLSSRQQALFVSHQVQAAMFSQPKITARRREGGAKELQEFDK